MRRWCRDARGPRGLCRSAWTRSSCVCWCRAGMRLPRARHSPLPTVLELLSRHGVRPRMASLEMSAARHHGFLHEDGGAVLVICDGRYPEQFPDVEAVPFAEGEGMELPTYLAWRREAPAARMAALAECLRDSR